RRLEGTFRFQKILKQFLLLCAIIQSFTFKQLFMDQVSVYSGKFMQWASVFGPKLLGALVVFIIGLYLTNVVARLVSKGLNRRGVDISLQSFLGSLVSGGLKVLLLITVAGMSGIQTTSFVAVVGALG